MNPAGDVYEYNFGTEVTSLIGSSVGSMKTIILYQQVLYFFGGTKIKQYDGSGTLVDAVAYRPIVEIGGELDGTGASSFEELNLYTDEIQINRIGDGVTTAVTLLFDMLTVTSITVDGTPTTYTFTAPRTLNITGVTPTDNSIIEIQGTIADESISEIDSNDHAIVFGPNDSQVFIWGHDNNTVRFSAAGKPTYFATSAVSFVGTDEQPINDMKPINDRLLAFKDDTAKYTFAQINPLYEGNEGLNQYIYEFFDMNDKYGGVATAQVIGQNSLYTGWRCHSKVELPISCQ